MVRAGVSGDYAYAGGGTAIVILTQALKIPATILINLDI